MDLRVGDVLRISCPFTEALVTGRQQSGGEVVLKWPWWSVDPDCEWIHWNGEVAVHGDAGQGEQARGLFRTDPAPHRLSTGDMCRVGIPPTLVHVIDVAHYSPPQETGRLPRPTRLVVVLPAGLSFDSRLEEQGESFDPDDDIPLAFDLVFRPYAFLEPGDEVADKAGRAWRFDGPWDWHPFDGAEPHEPAWRFDGPWDWHPFDGAEPHEPAWPLSLLTRVNATTAEVEIAVADATKSGSHQEECARWSAVARANPPSCARPPAATAVVNSGEQRADGSAACSSPVSRIHTDRRQMTVTELSMRSSPARRTRWGCPST